MRTLFFFPRSLELTGRDGIRAHRFLLLNLLREDELIIVRIGESPNFGRIMVKIKSELRDGDGDGEVM